MSKVLVYAIRDIKVGTYMRPFFENNDIHATRALAVAVRDPGTQISHFPADFELWQVAEFDETTGKFENSMMQKFIVGAVTLKQINDRIEGKKPDENS